MKLLTVSSFSSFTCHPLSRDIFSIWQLWPLQRSTMAATKWVEVRSSDSFLTPGCYRKRVLYRSVALLIIVTCYMPVVHNFDHVQSFLRSSSSSALVNALSRAAILPDLHATRPLGRSYVSHRRRWAAARSLRYALSLSSSVTTPSAGILHLDTRSSCTGTPEAADSLRCIPLRHTMVPPGYSQ